MIRSALRLNLAAPLLLASAFALTAPVLGCSSDVGTHILAIDGSAAVMDGIETADNWTVSFEQVAVVLHRPGLIERVDNDPAWVRENGVTVWDVAAELGEDDVLSRQIRVGSYDGADFRIGPASESGYQAEAGNVSADLLDEAIADDWSIHVLGSATSIAMQTVSFDWSFATSTLVRCEFEGDGVVEVALEGDETTTIEIAAEVLLRETADAGADLRFDAIAAADADGDGEVTQTELESAGLWERIEALSKQIGTVRGAVDGCEAIDE